MNYLKSIFGVAISNIISFGTSFIIGFILPAILSVEDFGNYKAFILYTSFAYIFNLGFNDGIYIKYGGKNKSDINNKIIQDEHNFIFIYHIVILIISFLFGLFYSNYLILLFGIAVFFINMVTFHQNFLQAIGEFQLFSKSNILKSIIYFFSLVLSIYILKISDFKIYIILFLTGYLILFVIYELYFVKNYKISFEFTLQNKYTILKIGFFILIANMSQSFVGNIGSWVVNIFYTIENFAQYSFQNSLLNVILLIVNAIGLVFYNLLSKQSDKKLLMYLKKVCLLLGVISGLAFFIFKFIIVNFLPNYIPSITLLSVTFIAIPYIMISKIIIANLYKVKRTARKYFFISILFSIISTVIVISVSYLSNSILWISISTTLCYILWYIYTTIIEFNFIQGAYSVSIRP